jgi:ABC-type multidrug transport system permease subunit
MTLITLIIFSNGTSSMCFEIFLETFEAKYLPGAITFGIISVVIFTNTVAAILFGYLLARYNIFPKTPQMKVTA